MSDPKDFAAGIGSDQRKNPVRVAFVTRRTSAQVKEYDEEKLQSFPEVLFRAAIAIEVLACVLILISLVSLFTYRLDRRAARGVQQQLAARNLKLND